MVINKLEIKGLYGHMNKSISFFPDISLLVGINGSGKTSVLNIINWLLNPSFGELCVTEFDSIDMTFNHKEIAYEINCIRSKNILEYKVKSDTVVYPTVTFRMIINPSEIRNSEILRNRYISEYNIMTPDKNEQVTIFFLRTEIPNPMNVGLDRGIKNSEVDSDEFNRKGKLLRNKEISNNVPLNRIKNLINTNYRKKKNSISNLNNNLRNQLMLSAFDGIITKESIIKKVQNQISLKQIEAVEKGVYKYFLDLDSELSHQNENSVIKKYFMQLKEIIKNYESTKKNNMEAQDSDIANINSLLFMLNAKQFHKTTKMLTEFKKFEDQSTIIMKQVNEFIDTINSFFKDSSKQLLFKEDTSEICYNSLSKDGKKVLAKYQDIDTLSSGEKQLLILFAFLAFNATKEKVFIIDEPELSLHIKWQEDFLPSISKVAPEGTQIILATHSPILVNNVKSKAILLLPYNNN